MKSEGSGNRAGSAGKEEHKKSRHSLISPPQLTLDPERRRDFFNRLLEKYSTKSTKLGNPPPGISFGPRSTRFPSVPPTKTPNKIKEKLLRKKKASSEKSVVKPVIIDDNGELDPVEAWKNSVRNHVFDPSVYKNHVRIRTRFPIPMPTIEEFAEPTNSSEGSDAEGSKSGDSTSFKSINHSFTFLPSGDQNHESKENLEIRYEEKIIDGESRLPEELQARHLTKTQSGTLIWVGNDTIHSLVQKKSIRRSPAEDALCEKEKLAKEMKSVEDMKSCGEGEERPIKKGSHSKKSKIKKYSSVQDFEEANKMSKLNLSSFSLDSKDIIKPSSSSLPLLGQEDVKAVKKLNEKVKKPKKLTKKQTYTLVTTKPTL